MSEQINQHRRRFFSTAAMTIAVTQFTLADMAGLIYARPMEIKAASPSRDPVVGFDWESLSELNAKPPDEFCETGGLLSGRPSSRQ